MSMQPHAAVPLMMRQHAVSCPPMHPPVASMQCRVPKGYQVLKEGLGSILKKGNDVFYNEAQAGAGSSWARVACHDGQAKAGVASKRVGAVLHGVQCTRIWD